jgi:hypothetical protein|tara:strand:+ start:430 stop:2265 length:1836 start_codon:yes stop_codon:yes gene_type:complete
MGLLNLKTDLKSLRYGRDRIGGGNSIEPFITKSVDSTPGDTGGPDFLLRANTLQHTADDLARMSKFLTSPKGLQFSTKQNVLSRTSVKIQSSSDNSYNPINDGVYLPTSTLAQLAVGSAGSHLLKQGLNPFRNTSQSGANTGVGLIDNILNAELPLEQPIYVKRVNKDQSASENRLVNLVNAKIGIASTNSNNSIDTFLGSLTGGGIKGFGSGLFNNIFSKGSNSGLGINDNQQEILRYNGGPGSILGVGQTTIRRVTNTNNTTPFLYNYSELVEAGDSKTSKDQILPDFRKLKNPENNQSIISTSLDYTTGRNGNYEERVNLGNPGRRNKNLSNYNIGAGGGALDKINALPLYSSTGVIKGSVKNDFIKFRIGILDNKQNNGTKTYIHFRAFIDSFTDNYAAQWSEEKFMGRAESFYRYGGFKRSISMGWTLAAQSIDELIPMYQKLNYLASSLAPDYSDDGYMQGNIAYLTFGGYCFEQPGVITGLNLSYPKESPFEIDIDSQTGKGDGGKKTKELPMIMTVSGFEFKPIHNFVPRVQQNTFDGLKTGKSTFISSWGKEHYIALANKNGNNYDGDDGMNNFTIPSSKTEQESKTQSGTEFTKQAKGLTS